MSARQARPAPDRLTELSPLGHVVHVGAGSGQDLASYLAAGPREITLIEPDPDDLVLLRRRVSGHDRVRVLPFAVSARSGQAELRRFSFGALDSLRMGTGVFELYPGLRARDPVRVEVLGPKALAASLELPWEVQNVLVIEAPGVAFEILDGLAAAGCLERFHLLRVQTARRPLYEGEVTLAQIRDRLAAAGFDHAPALIRKDPERPVFEVTANAGLSARVPLKSLRAAEAERDRLARENERWRETAEARRDRVLALDGELKRDREAAQAALDKAQTGNEALGKTVERLRNRVARLERARDELVRAEGHIELIRDLLLKEKGE